MWWQALLAVGTGLVVAWAALVVVLVRHRPDDLTLHDLARLLPDVLRLVTRLARDRTLPRSTRWKLLALAAYLASPVDLVPDFVPVVGFADDAVLTALVLRSVVRAADPEVLRRHWPGTPAGLDALRRLVGGAARDAPSSGDA